MGKPSWDKISANDVLVLSSRAHFERKKSKFLFILHRELEIDAALAHWLSVALTSEAVFNIRVPAFLRWWSSGETKGLKALAKLIENGKLNGKDEWRFCVSPIPHDLIVARSRQRASNHVFEIRFIADVALAYRKSGLSASAAKAGQASLAQDDGVATRAFFAALEVIKDAYPAYAEAIAAIFPQS